MIFFLKANGHARIHLLFKIPWPTFRQHVFVVIPFVFPLSVACRFRNGCFMKSSSNVILTTLFKAHGHARINLLFKIPWPTVRQHVFFYSISIPLACGIQFQKWLLDEILFQCDCCFICFVFFMAHGHARINLPFEIPWPTCRRHVVCFDSIRISLEFGM